MKKTIVALLCALSALSVAQAAPNVALGSSVALNGAFFTNSDGWPLGTNGTGPDLVNGIYQPENQQWNFNSVWWNGNDGPDNNIVITLPGEFDISGFKVQADDNDTYRIEYLGLDTLWHTAWDIPAPNGFGLTTSSTTLGSIITTTALRFTATGGDGLYAVSQIEADGVGITTHGTVPETAGTFALFGGALGLIGLARRFKTVR
jgi:hypothetical protein